jgi:hypothetical protein
MNIPHINDLTALLEGPRAPSVSMYLNAQPGFADPRQGQLRIKNMVTEAEQRLTDLGLRTPDARALLGPAERARTSPDFWHQGGRGLALFLNAGGMKSFQLPVPFQQEQVLVGDRFHLKPLLPVVYESGRFYVLALTQDWVKFYRGSAYEMTQLDTPKVPQGIGKAEPYDSLEGTEPFHSRLPEARGEMKAMHRGLDISTEMKDHLLRYFRDVDAGLHDLLRTETAPLVFAGVEYYFPMFQQACSYRFLADQPITGSPGLTRPEALRESAWAIVRPRFEQARKRDTEQFFHQLGLGTGKASKELADILAAAMQGRVHSLFVRHRAQVWGTADGATGKVEVHAEPWPGDSDLTELAAFHTLTHKGAVYANYDGDVPGGNDVAALYRF